MADDILSGINAALGYDVAEDKPLRIDISGNSASPKNNPGNIRPAGKSTGFQSYDTPEAGVQAIDDNLKAYQKKGVTTLAGIISRWSPPNENDTPTLIKNAAKHTGLDPNAPLDVTNNPEHLQLVRDAIIKQEGVGTSQPTQADPDSIMGGINAALSQTTVPKTEKKAITGKSLTGTGESSIKSPLDATIGTGEALVQAGTGAVGQVVGGLVGAAGALTGHQNSGELGQRLAHELTFQPRTPQGQEMAAVPGKLLGKAEEGINAVGSLYGYPKLGETVMHPGAALANAVDPIAESIDRNTPDWIKQHFPSAGGMLHAAAATAPTAAATLLGLRKGAEAEAAPTVPAAPAASVGARATLPNAQAVAMASNASPEIQAAVKDTVSKFGKVNTEALERHVQADSLPVPIKLSKGQATQDPVDISNEMITRATRPQAVEHMQANNQGLIDNVAAIKAEAAPDVYTQTPAEHATKIIDAYKEKDAALTADIGAKYKALTDANGGMLPIDTNAFIANTDAALLKELKTNHLPSEIARDLDHFRQQGSMTLEQFEAMRTNLANIQRSSANGNARAAAGIVREQLENMPMSPEFAGLKDLADTARAAAKSRFDLLRADPAYNAVVNGKALPDTFATKHIVGADSTRVKTMMDNLSHDPVAQQTVGATILDHLAQRAGIQGGRGNFSQAGFNRTLANLQDKIPVVFDQKTVSNLKNLGDVANYTQFQPRGSFVNNSNTLVAWLGENAKSAAETYANMKVPGLQVGTMARKLLSGRADKKAIYEAYRPGAGIEPRAK